MSIKINVAGASYIVTKIKDAKRQYNVSNGNNSTVIVKHDDGEWSHAINGGDYMVPVATLGNGIDEHELGLKKVFLDGLVYTDLPEGATWLPDAEFTLDDKHYKVDFIKLANVWSVYDYRLKD